MIEENFSTLYVVACRQSWLVVFRYLNTTQLSSVDIHWSLSRVYGSMARRNAIYIYRCGVGKVCSLLDGG